MKHQQTITYRKINEENIRLINEDLKGYNWQEILETTGTDETFQTLHETLIMSMNKHMPLETKKLTKKTPAMNHGSQKVLKGVLINRSNYTKKYRQESNRQRPQEIQRIQKHATKSKEKGKNGSLSRKMHKVQE